MLHWGVQCENRKKTPQHKSTYTINTLLATGGHIQLWQAAVRSSSHLLWRRSQTCSTGGGTKRAEAVDLGRGVMSVMGEGSKRVYSASLSQGCYPAWPWPKPAGTGKPEKIRLHFVVSFGANSCIPSQLYSLCPFWSLKSSIFTCKAVSFNMMASIFRFIVSVSLLTALPTASIKTGSLVRFWTAVPVFPIFR